MKKIGILAVHGSVEEHAKALKQIGIEPVEVRSNLDFENIEGLIIPGGESTTISDLTETFHLKDRLIKFATTKLQTGNCELPPIFGTCAGLILLAEYDLLDVKVKRNAYGRQLDSFEADFPISILDKKEYPGVFIRAPMISEVEPNVSVLAKYDGAPIFVRQANVWGASFHPELTQDLRIHKIIFLP